MRVTIAQHHVKTTVVEVSDSLTEIVKVFEAATDPDAKVVGFDTFPLDQTKSIVKLTNNEGVVYMAQEGGRLMFTREGFERFDDIKEKSDADEKSDE